MTLARSHVGMREIPGPTHNQAIVDWWQDMGAPFRDDETPWCGAFMDHILRSSGEETVETGQVARKWLNLPVTLDEPAVGCVVVLWRESPTSWKGHAGFLVGKTETGDLLLLGGNQHDAVTVEAFPASRVLGYRWPDGQPDREFYNVPTLNNEQIAALTPATAPAHDHATVSARSTRSVDIPSDDLYILPASPEPGSSEERTALVLDQDGDGTAAVGMSHDILLDPDILATDPEADDGQIPALDRFDLDDVEIATIGTGATSYEAWV
ncbi:TIGR02594 family protein [Chelatococcus asaccharovorans]|uniref:TIGR02594 family protein n=1 Tax=Chelatococcus asaccharovorans TaxID=28210 RepID=UPI00224C69C1|nr:TIGR02594 family protein [Chelatococcus asaccharovorans]CAH1653592.1 conserved hypothetical protein [Chelatococcus asaccharovorans]CAH1694211.1 conserved hypothetical protein [Chelatococcus asaccharovorans]